MQKMPIRKLANWSAALLLAAITVAALAALVLLSRASVQTTAHGAPTRLRLHLPSGRDIAIPVYVGRRGQGRIPGFLDGPVVRRDGAKAWSATWFCENRAHQIKISADVLHIECAGRRHAFPLQSPPVPAAVAPMPARVVVLSDLEGNIAFLDGSLRALGIVDAAGDWAYGAGHLVVLGDSVDRGRDVFAVLWRLHALAAQAGAAGGAVHVMLGNHEQYMLRTNPSRANPEHLYALNMMGGYRHAFEADTVIGAWLRQQPVALKLGTVLFVHGGISPEVTRSGLSIPQLNAAMRNYWRAPGAHPSSPALDAVLSTNGVTQYRGFFRAIEGSYPLASDADVAQALDRFGADLVVVGHTVMPAVTRLRGGRVYAVDVNSDESASEVLIFEEGTPRVVDIGVARKLGDTEPAFRGFSLFDSGDRKLLGAMYKDLRRLSALPYPY
jgi:hypothetical protein